MKRIGLSLISCLIDFIWSQSEDIIERRKFGIVVHRNKCHLRRFSELEVKPELSIGICVSDDRICISVSALIGAVVSHDDNSLCVHKSSRDDILHNSAVVSYIWKLSLGDVVLHNVAGDCLCLIQFC